MDEAVLELLKSLPSSKPLGGILFNLLLSFQIFFESLYNFI